jgi:hypothetical protein
MFYDAFERLAVDIFHLKVCVGERRPASWNVSVIRVVYGRLGKKERTSRSKYRR